MPKCKGGVGGGGCVCVWGGGAFYKLLCLGGGKGLTWGKGLPGGDWKVKGNYVTNCYYKVCQVLQTEIDLYYCVTVITVNISYLYLCIYGINKYMINNN